MSTGLGRKILDLRGIFEEPIRFFVNLVSLRAAASSFYVVNNYILDVRTRILHTCDCPRLSRYAGKNYLGDFETCGEAVKSIRKVRQIYICEDCIKDCPEYVPPVVVTSQIPGPGVPRPFDELLLKDLFARNLLSQRLLKSCELQGLQTLADLRAYYRETGSFRGLYRCGVKLDYELTELCTRMELEDFAEIKKTKKQRVVVPRSEVFHLGERGNVETGN